VNIRKLEKEDVFFSKQLRAYFIEKLKILRANQKMQRKLI